MEYFVQVATPAWASTAWAAKSRLESVGLKSLEFNQSISIHFRYIFTYDE